MDAARKFGEIGMTRRDWLTWFVGFIMAFSIATGMFILLGIL